MFYGIVSFDARERHFAIVLDFDLKLERLIVDGSVMSVKPLGDTSGTHSAEDGHLGAFQLQFGVNAQGVRYVLQFNNAETIKGEAELSEQARAMITAEANEKATPNTSKTSGFVLVGIGLKLLKSFNVIKLALIGASAAVYSLMFTVEFALALALIAVLMFHEYGHVRAMKRFGIPTKGFYLIPFMGGIAVGKKPELNENRCTFP